MIIFRYKNIPVKLHFSFYILAAFLILPEIVMGNFENTAFISIMGVSLFGSVIVHEFGHALMARKFGIDTRSITLYPFGGIALLDSEPLTSRSEFYIALAGPAVNLVLCLVFLPFALINIPFCSELIAINLVLGVFNLIPAFPMDGGRVLRAFLSTRMPRHKATLWSLEVSKVFAWIFIIGGWVTNSMNLMFLGGILFFFVWSIKRQLER